MTDEQIAAATVGERQPLNGPIHLAPYDPSWAQRFEQHAQRIRKALGERVLLLEHVGSTSVPGLAAKPIVDIVLAVARSADEPSYVPPLEKEGYVLRIREPDWFQHRLLKPPDRSANVHVFSQGCAEIERMLLFRDWLRTNPTDRQLYENNKRTLAARTWKHTQNYADAKSQIIAQILTRARQPLD